MKTKQLVIILLLFFNLGFAQNQMDVKDKFSRAELVEDLEMLWTIIKDHPKLYEYTCEKEFKQIYSEIEANLKDNMSANDFLRLAYPLVGQIGCGHSILWPPQSYVFNPDGKTVPLSLKYDEENVYILKTYPEGQIPFGSILLSINEKSIEEIKSTLLSYISTDGLTPLPSKRYAAGVMFGLIYPKLFDTDNDYKIKYQLYDSEEIREITLDAYETKAIWMPRMMEMQSNPYIVEYRDDLKAAIIKIKTFFYGGGNTNDAFYSFLDSTFSKIKEEKTPNLIIDLRGNGGGDPIAAAKFFSYIAPAKVKYFADAFDNYEKLAEPVELAENHYDRNIYTIIDGGGASTTGHLVSLIKYHKIGKLVGSELGSTFTCNDGCVKTPLKNTGLTAKVARTTFTTAVEGMRADQGVLPDYHVQFSIDDLVNGLDSEMEVISKLIK